MIVAKRGYKAIRITGEEGDDTCQSSVTELSPTNLCPLHLRLRACLSSGKNLVIHPRFFLKRMGLCNRSVKGTCFPYLKNGSLENMLLGFVS